MDLLLYLMHVQHDGGRDQPEYDGQRRKAEEDQANIEQNAAMRETPRGAGKNADFDRLPSRQPPTLANPTPQEIAAAQARGRIRDQEQPPPDLSEQDWPNPEGTVEAIANPYQHRQKQANP